MPASRTPGLRHVLRQRRWLFRIGGCGIAGGVVALQLALFRDVLNDTPVVYQRPLDPAADIAWLDRNMPPDLLQQFVVDAGYTGWRLNGTKRDAARLGEEATDLVFYRRDSRTVDRSPEGTATVHRLRRGWPFTCLEGSLWQAPSSAEPSGRRMAVMAAGSSRPLAFPFGIVWGGLLADAAIFGAVLVALSAVPQAAERWARDRAGRCAHCGQLLAGATRCPECGFERGSE